MRLFFYPTRADPVAIYDDECKNPNGKHALDFSRILFTFGGY